MEQFGGKSLYFSPLTIMKSHQKLAATCEITCVKAGVHEGQDQNKDADVENGLEDTGRGQGELGLRERVALTYVHYQM